MRKCVMLDANNKGAVQPAHRRNRICAFVVRCLDSIISLDSMGPWQTVQTQIRRRKTDQGLHFLLTGISI